MKRILRKLSRLARLDFAPSSGGKLYATHAEAVMRASAVGCNYDSGNLARAVVESTMRYRDKGAALLRQPISPMLCRRLLALELCRPQEHFSVLDFGGAAGQHYFEAAAHLPPKLRLRWHVVETEALADAARVLETENLKFFSSVEDAIADFSPDLVFSSGALQCMEDPITALRMLTKIRAPYLFLGRGSFCASPPSRYIVETSSLECHGPLPMPEFSSSLAAYALTIAPLREFESALEEFYEISLRFDETELFRNRMGTEQAVRMAYFCRLKNRG
ncbi:MAG: methyltransferase, TIGR04325 family [Chthoniobacterales bacterium]|nr:methyltransferase, TIGR04325 family [Chthoniobacterales bacterium]